MVAHTTDADFQKDLGGPEKLVVVDFWATWCGPCLAIAPILEEVEGEYNGTVKVLKLNVDEHPKTAVQYGIRSIPTLIFFKEGEMVDKVIGLVTKDRLKKVIEKHVNA